MLSNIFREKIETKTIKSMIKIYCHGQHRSVSEFCPKCEELLRYAIQRINHCPLKDNKTTCAQCSIHCYKPIMREKIRNIMRYAGPRMIYKHPILALYHFFYGLKPRFTGNIIKKNKEEH